MFNEDEYRQLIARNSAQNGRASAVSVQAVHTWGTTYGEIWRQLGQIEGSMCGDILIDQAFRWAVATEEEVKAGRPDATAMFEGNLQVQKHDLGKRSNILCLACFGVRALANALMLLSLSQPEEAAKSSDLFSEYMHQLAQRMPKL